MRSRRALAFALWRTGRVAEAADLYQQTLEEARALQHPEHTAYLLCGLGLCLLTQGKLDEAASPLLEALAIATRLMDRYLILSIEFHLADLWAAKAYLLAEGDADQRDAARREARARFERAIDLARA